MNHLDLVNWLDRRYLMNPGIVYRLHPDIKAEFSAQLVDAKNKR